jgi:muramoyltetrapeptide carboxypeptidase
MRLIKDEKYIKPAFLKTHNIAIISPSIYDGDNLSEHVKKGLENLNEMGFFVLDGKYICKEYPHSEEGFKKRAAFINEFYTNKEIAGLLCKSGGSGAKFILEFLDPGKIRANPKMLCGYSDDTYILLYLNDQFRMVVFHGPSLVFGIANLSETTKKYFLKVFSENDYPFEIKLDSFVSWNQGRVTGKVLGGNLTRLADYLDMVHSLDFKNKILFIEEMGETPGKLYLLFYKLKKKGVFEDIKGILIGQFGDLNQTELEAVRQQLLLHLKGKNIPILYGFKSGHGPEKITLPFGTDVTIDASNLKVIYNECPFK